MVPMRSRRLVLTWWIRLELQKDVSSAITKSVLTGRGATFRLPRQSAVTFARTLAPLFQVSSTLVSKNLDKLVFCLRAQRYLLRPQGQPE